MHASGKKPALSIPTNSLTPSHRLGTLGRAVNSQNLGLKKFIHFFSIHSRTQQLLYTIISRYKLELNPFLF